MTTSSPARTAMAHAIRATYQILNTYEAPGYNPRRVARARRNLRREWPELAGQLDLLAALVHHDPEPR